MSNRLPTYHLSVLLSVCFAWQAMSSAAADAADKDRYVVIVSIDGLAAYLLDDPQAPIPTVRRLAKEGAYVKQGMMVSNPAVTWPNHTSIVSGVRPEKHGVLANGVLVRGAEGVAVYTDPQTTRDELVRVPMLFEAAHAAGLTTGDVNWPCTRGAATLNDSFPDSPNALAHSTPRFVQDLIEAGILADNSDASFRANSVAGRDVVWTDAACYLIRHRMPNLLLIHLLNVDATHHTYGAQTPAGYTANAFADACRESRRRAGRSRCARADDDLRRRRPWIHRHAQSHLAECGVTPSGIALVGRHGQSNRCPRECCARGRHWPRLLQCAG